MLLLNPPWQLDQTLRAALPLLQKVLGETGASSRVEWLKQAD
jgi:23S rRNA (adenine2030-N6)-methyltransferase